MLKIISLSLAFVVGMGIGFSGKTFQFNYQLGAIAENSQAKFVSAPTPGGGFQAPSGGSCGG